MCGIVGYVGKRQAGPILLEGLAKLEYRGYDSAGVAVCTPEGKIEIAKAEGRLANLCEKTDDGQWLEGYCGIGHTRWATHGEPTETNAHPHTSFYGKVVGVHNGIIENYLDLKAKLERHDYKFYSQTDTEIAINLVEYYLGKYQMGPIHAITHAMLRIRGSYALAIMFKDEPGKIYLARKDSPMVVGITPGEAFIASDVPAIVRYTRDIYYIGNNEVALTDGESVKFFNIDQEEINHELVHVDMDPAAAEKGGFRHFMMKEIMEQPRAIEDTLRYVKKTDRIDLSSLGLDDKFLSSIKQVYITGCGSAYHTGVVAQYVIEDLAKVPVRVELASEMRYREMPLNPDSLLILISQSGETADTLAALRKAKEHGIKTLAIVNVDGSSIAREADYVFLTLAGPEIAVATTKAYSAQLIALYSIALELAYTHHTISDEQYVYYLGEIASIPEKVKTIVQDKRFLQRFGARKSGALNVFFIGRGIDYAVGLEGSLKLKEISYIHSEAYAAGELKHGTISLIEEDTLVIGLMTQPELAEKTLSNMVEVQARGATLLAVSMDQENTIKDTTKNIISLPTIDPHFAASLAVIPLQILAYYVAVAKGLDVDKPRNLAKSVTVE